MKEEWASAVITKIAIAVYVPQNGGKSVHKDRPYHGFVLNDKGGVKDYYFSDGRVLHTESEALFYLPKGSSYTVKNIGVGGCYAINFDADIEDTPFSVVLRDFEPVKKMFRTACHEWNDQTAARSASARHALYGGICQLCREQQKDYMPPAKHTLIEPALLEINNALTDNTLSVSRLAALCGMSEVYLRKIFVNRFGVSPKEYIIRRRMEYASQLLASGQLDVCDVALLCGYAEPCHFSREFKKRFGTPPRNF